jgi:hypothetical protein
MSEQATQAAGEALQFDRVVAEPRPDAPEGLVCTTCRAAVTTAYYQVNGQPVCRSCRATLHASAETPRGSGPFVLALLFGIGAGIAGAVIYYAVIAITHFEIGIVAILIGYMVGLAVRKGAGGGGGRRFQVLAALLTYASVAFAYTPLAVHQVMKSSRPAQQKQQNTESGETADISPLPAAAEEAAPLEERSRPTAGQPFLGATMVLGLVLALPVLVVIGSFPSGLISAFIILIGMRQAWRMTAVPSLEILGPFRVGASQAPTAP